MRALVVLILDGEEWPHGRPARESGNPGAAPAAPVKGRFLLANRHNLPFSAKNLFPQV
ncbi:MAG: hypothetical protein IH889_11390 [Planctomycetes bacterium]|nr:hypothetical protein [Planctomycetota bacterium]